MLWEVDARALSTAHPSHFEGVPHLPDIVRTYSLHNAAEVPIKSIVVMFEEWWC